jgi:alpha-tubulin suppressor-like RCC1 family protein
MPLVGVIASVALGEGMQGTRGSRFGRGRQSNNAALGLATEAVVAASAMKRAIVVLALVAVSAWLAPTASGFAGSETLRHAVGAGMTKATAVSAGKRHACALSSAGDVACWGANGTGQLGDGSSVDSSVPVPVKALKGTAVAVSAGGDHTCALTAAGRVECWGWNRFGQLGNGTHDDRHEPGVVADLRDAVAISAGGAHTCALKRSGDVACWGANRYGQLGDGTQSHRSRPVKVRGLSGEIDAISAGGRHTCALTTAGGVECWGANYWGQLGDGTSRGRFRAVAVKGLPDAAVSISAGRYFTCAVLRSGRVECWGANFLRQLGNDASSYSPAPMEVGGLEQSAVAVTAGGRHTCALTTAGLVACWGAGGYGQVGSDALGSSSTPTVVDIDGGPSLAVSAGAYHTCAVGANGGVACWGSNFFGQLGDGAFFQSPDPVRTTGLSGSPSSITSGEGHTCVLTQASSAECWGWNRFGQLGDGSVVDRPRATVVSGLRDAVAATAGGRHACAVARPTAGATTVECWGANGYGQLGDGGTVDSTVPVAVKGLAEGAATVSAGARHTCAVTSDGLVECWGANGKGQVGTGVVGGRLGVSRVDGLTGVVAADAGAFHTCAVARAGSVACWGLNDDGQLGDGTRRDSPRPVPVIGLPGNVVAVTAGGRHTCVLTGEGEMYCWGANDVGELGNGTFVDSPEPIAVGTMSGVVAIDAGSRHTCAVRSGGDLACWGANDWGQLGDGTRVTRPLPALVPSLVGPARALSLGDDHTCAVLGSGEVECWGFNYFGQLGDGRAPLSGSPSPVAVVGFGADASRLSD